MEQNFLKFLLPYMEEVKQIVESGSFVTPKNPIAEGESVIGVCTSEQKGWYTLYIKKTDEYNNLVRQKKELQKSSEAYEGTTCIACSLKEGKGVYHYNVQTGQEDHPDVATVNESNKKLQFLDWEIDLIKKLMWASIEFSTKEWEAGLHIRSNWQIVELPEEDDDDDDGVHVIGIGIIG